MPVAIFAVALALLAAQVDVPLAVAVRDAPDAQWNDVEVTNTGTKVAVAWALRIEHGTQGPTHQSIDIVARLAQEGGADRLLSPDRTNTDSKVSKVEGAVTAIVPLAVVYEDNTAIGDPERIAFIFERRRTDADEWDRVLPILERLSDDVTPQSLRFAAAELLGAGATPPAGVRPGEGVRRGLANNLELAAKSDNPAYVLSHIIESGRRAAANLRAHATRR